MCLRAPVVIRSRVCVSIHTQTNTCMQTTCARADADTRGITQECYRRASGARATARIRAAGTPKMQAPACAPRLARSALGSPSASGRGRGPRTAVPAAGSNTVAGSGPQRAGRTCAAAGRAAEPPPAARVRGAAAGGFAILWWLLGVECGNGELMVFGGSEVVGKKNLCQQGSLQHLFRIARTFPIFQNPP